MKHLGALIWNVVFGPRKVEQRTKDVTPAARRVRDREPIAVEKLQALKAKRAGKGAR